MQQGQRGIRLLTFPLLGQTEVRGTQPDLDVLGDDAGASSFLDRERAVLGDEFATPNDNAATVEDADEDDLLGGGGGVGGGQDFQTDALQQDELGDFESSFPAMDSTNEVRQHCTQCR